MSTFSEDTDGWTPAPGEACGDTMCGGHRGSKQVCVSPHASVYQSVTWTVWTSSLSTDVSLDIKTGSYYVIRWRSGVLPPPQPHHCPLVSSDRHSGVPRTHQGPSQSGGFCLSSKAHNKAWGVWKWLGSPRSPKGRSVYLRPPACL